MFPELRPALSPSPSTQGLGPHLTLCTSPLYQVKSLCLLTRLATYCTNPIEKCTGLIEKCTVLGRVQEVQATLITRTFIKPALDMAVAQKPEDTANATKDLKAPYSPSDPLNRSKVLSVFVLVPRVKLSIPEETQQLSKQQNLEVRHYSDISFVF